MERKRRARPSVEAPAVNETCGQCGKAFKSEFDMQWWNHDDPRLSAWVCTECFLALAEDRRQKATAATREAAKEALPKAADQTAAMRERLQQVHLHKWVLIGEKRGPTMAAPTTFLFYCNECPFDNPTLKEVIPERVG